MSSLNVIDLKDVESNISFVLDMFYKNNFPKIKTIEYLGDHVLKGDNGGMPVEIKLVMEVRQK